MIRSLLSAVWALVVCYPDPRVLLTAIRNTLRPPISAEAVAAWARSLPDDPAAIERAVHERVQYAVPWQSAGVPWALPGPAQTVARGLGDCQARAVVLASVLAAKGIPYQLRASLDHMWVEYPGKAPTVLENAAKTLWAKEEEGFRFRVPKVDWGESWRIEREYFWDAAPVARKVGLVMGLLVIWVWPARQLRSVYRWVLRSLGPQNPEFSAKLIG